MASEKEIHDFLVSGQSEGKTVRTLKDRGLTGSRHQIILQIGGGSMGPRDVVTPVDQAAAQTKSRVAEAIGASAAARKPTKRKASSSRRSQAKKRRTSRSSSKGKRRQSKKKKKKKKKKTFPKKKVHQKGKGSKKKKKKTVRKRKSKATRASTSDVFTRTL